MRLLWVSRGIVQVFPPTLSRWRSLGPHKGNVLEPSWNTMVLQLALRVLVLVFLVVVVAVFVGIR